MSLHNNNKNSKTNKGENISQKCQRITVRRRLIDSLQKGYIPDCEVESITRR